MGAFDGKVAFITGAARGQGRAHAVALAAQGADILAVDICQDYATVAYPLATTDDLAETERQVTARGRRIVAVRADVRDLDELSTVVSEGVATLGGLDIVSANAGIISLGPALEFSPAQWNDVIDTNLTGVWHTVKAAAPHLIERGGGSIVITSSLAGVQGQRNAISYVVSKHGLIGMMKALANEFAPYGIRVNTINPTNVSTPMLLNDSMYRIFRPELDAPTELDAHEHFAALNLMPVPYVEPVDVSNALIWLCSDLARYVTGISLPIDAGGAVKTR